MRYDGNWRAQRFYRDPPHGKLMGVCAGLADYFGWNVTLVRGLAIVALIWFNVVTLALYPVLGFVLPTKPDALYDWDADEEYWRSVRRSMPSTRLPGMSGDAVPTSQRTMPFSRLSAGAF